MNYVDVIMDRINDRSEGRHKNMVFTSCYGQTLLVNDRNEIIINFHALREAFILASANSSPECAKYINDLEMKVQKLEEKIKSIAEIVRP